MFSRPMSQGQKGNGLIFNKNAINKKFNQKMVQHTIENFVFKNKKNH